MKLTRIAKKLNQSLYPGHLFYPPEWLVLGVNNVCNLHCKMCDVGTGTTETNFAQNLVGARPLHMPMELITTILQQAARYYPRIKIGYAFTEPLVYTHLEESLRLAKSLDLYTSITTNALTLPQKAAAISDAGLNELLISLDGVQDTHNFIRGNKNSFQKAEEGIENVLAQKHHPSVSVFCVITEWNITGLYDFLSYFNRFPLKQVGFMHTSFVPQELADAHNRVYGNTYPATPSNISETHIQSTDIDMLWEQIKRIRSNQWNFPVTFSPEIDSPERLRDYYQHPEVPFGTTCNDAFRNLMIKSNGEVIPAHGRCYTTTLGNLYEQSLPHIWNSATAARFRATLQQAGGLLPACSRCCSAFQNPKSGVV
jgi:radical SAM protein with 4Fe4S-binding SPASM domain